MFKKDLRADVLVGSFFMLLLFKGVEFEAVGSNHSGSPLQNVMD